MCHKTDLKRLAIMGAGPAGLTAAIYAARAGMEVTVFDGGFIGGQTALTPEIENFPGIDFIEGYEFGNRLRGQAETLGTTFVDENITEIDMQPLTVYTNSGAVYQTDALIVAGGVQRRKLGCKGEEQFAGVGVSYCATCDGAFFRDRVVAVNGGGNTALEDALYLANICQQVYLIHRKPEFRGEEILQQAVRNNPKIQLLMNSTILEIKGDDAGVNSIIIEESDDGDNKRQTEVSVDAIFVAIGMKPENSLIAETGVVELDKSGFIIADESCRTQDPRIFVAGDCRTKEHRQIITAAADGAVAAMNAVEWLQTSM